ncbi:hypothetical protein AAMO2058_001247700 [Amorphochlora amoebiformis]
MGNREENSKSPTCYVSTDGVPSGGAGDPVKRTRAACLQLCHSKMSQCRKDIMIVTKVGDKLCGRGGGKGGEFGAYFSKMRERRLYWRKVAVFVSVCILFLTQGSTPLLSFSLRPGFTSNPAILRSYPTGICSPHRILRTPILSRKYDPFRKALRRSSRDRESEGDENDWGGGDRGAQEWGMEESTCKSLRSYWFGNSNHWFASTEKFDSEVLELFGLSLEGFLSTGALRYYGEGVKSEVLRGLELDKWLESTQPADILAHILLWDQVSRHYRRVHTAPTAVSRVSDMAVRSTTYLLKNHLQMVETWPTSWRMFLLMPYRHTFQATPIRHSLQWAKRFAKLPGEDLSLWRRFDQAGLKALSPMITKNLTAIKPSENQGSLSFSSWDSFHDILEVNPTFNETVKAVRNLRTISDEHATQLPTVKQVGLFLRSHIQSSQPPLLVVSISGGVDSVLLLYAVRAALIKLKDTGSAVPQLACVHINYANRVTADHEASFVKGLCELMQIPLWIRKISEIQRTRDSNREFYEDFTREIRFSTYKTAINKTIPNSANVDCPVLLGHNRDDTYENLLANVGKGQKYDTLRGMESTGSEQETLIWRPLLKVSKAQIYADATSLALPHLWDSTPSWSDRGRMRDKIIPFLSENLPRLLPGLERLADHVGFLAKAWNRQLEEYFSLVEYYDGPNACKQSLNPLMSTPTSTLVSSNPTSSSITSKSNGLQLGEYSKWAILPLPEWIYEAPGSFWGAFFAVLVSRWDIPPPSHKSMDQLQAWLIRARDGRILGRVPTFELSRHYRAIFSPTGHLTIVVRKQEGNSADRIERRTRKSAEKPR